jgi:hypothetical protein
MKTMSVNGKLRPVDDTRVITDEYTGHFLYVSYSQEIGGQAVFGKERVDVAGDGVFRFYILPQDQIVNEMVTVEAYAPDGELLGRQVYSFGSLNASEIPIGADDDSSPLTIVMDPKIIEFGSSSPVEDAIRKISGKVIDLTGTRKGAGLEILLMVSNDPGAEFDSSTYRAVFSAVTDKEGYFYGQVKNETVQTGYGVIAGLEDRPVVIALEENKIPKQILLVTDLSNLPAQTATGEGAVPTLPDQGDLVHSSSFAQDVGGGCVDFTVPDRTLEEFSFYHTVRTTEPEIRGLTISSKESATLKAEFTDLSDLAFDLVGRLNDSFNSLALIPFAVEELPAADMSLGGAVRMAGTDTGTPQVSQVQSPSYMIKLDVGAKEPFKVNTRDLVYEKSRFEYVDVVKLVTEQAQRRKKLLALHQKLAAAYCGKYGVEREKTYCESLTASDGINRSELSSLLGHVDKNRAALGGVDVLKKQLDALIFELEKLIGKPAADKNEISAAITLVEKAIQAVDINTVESQIQENILGYLRRIIIELANAGATSGLSFEPCPPMAEAQTMGIMCLIQKFQELKQILENKSVFSYGEIVELKAYYAIFLRSINSFRSLLDEFYTFYNTSTDFAIELTDNYFYEEYGAIKGTLTALKRQIFAALRKTQELERAYLLNHPGRVNLSAETSVDWDETPTIYENTTIAHGHILHFKQKYKSAGFSLGTLLNSLPLAPCQEKQIAIYDWDRTERASRVEELLVAEELDAEISRDRDISEIVNSVFGESIRASSSNKTSSTSAGIGGGVGGFLSGVVFGIAGGVAHSGASSTSTASQDASRNLAASSLSQLQDTTTQSASSLRSQRSSVVQAVGQNESVSVQTEVIKNNNHCHAITVEYFEVLKHYVIEQELVGVQECLFVPLPMSHFDNQKVLRWRHTLEPTMHGRKIRRGFEAIERIETNYANSDLPAGSYADEAIEDFSGFFTITFELQRPQLTAIDEATKTETIDLHDAFPWFFGFMKFRYDVAVPLTEAEKDALFEAQYAPGIVRDFIDRMEIHAIADNGTEEKLQLDVTLLSNYAKGVPLRVSLASGALQNITRNQIKHLRVRAATEVKLGSRIILRSFYLQYKTPHLNEYIYRNANVNNDIINTVSGATGVVTDSALMYTPLNKKETAHPRKEDQEAAAALVSYLNENMELAHKVIWSKMDASRLFGLLDRYIAPHSGERSVASVVDNRVMGVVGNNLVMKVVPGERLDPVFKGVENLLDFYKPTTPPDPFRISVPTKGVYAEAVMGKCNSCEVIDETRNWRFSEEPCGTAPTAIQPISTDSRRSDPGDLTPKDLPTSLINLQTAPAAPDPTGLAAAFALLGKGDAFKDMTGLAGTQANALGALQTTSKSVTDLAGISKDFANMAVMASQNKDGAKQIEQIKKLNKDGYLTDAEASEQIKGVLGTYTDAAKNITNSKSKDSDSVPNKIADTVLTQGMPSPDQEIEYQKVGADGETESIKVGKPASLSDASAKPLILLTGSTASADLRAFKPSTQDKSLIIEVGASFKNAPDGSSLRWSSPTAGALIIDTPKANKTRVKGVTPGKHDLDVELLDSGGNRIASMKLKLSVPQCVTVNEDPALFDAALINLHLAGHKNEVVNEMKRVVEHLLAKANVRVFWQFGGYNEALPAHVPAANVVTAIIQDKDPSGNLGLTSSTSAALDLFNETIDIYPGMYAEEDAIDVDTETQALILQLDESLPGDAALIPVMTKVYGRLIGETLSHEIGHALLWDDIPADGHNSPAIANDLMNRGVDRLFGQRTGMENTAKVSPVEPDHYVDHGLAAIGGFQAVNQALIDAQWPVPPAHG